jgi:hypothetical protein
MAPSAGATAYIFRHLVLPPKLPQEDDHNDAHELALFELVVQALETLKRYVNSRHVRPVMAAIATVENLYTSRDNYGNVSELQLEILLSRLANGETIETVPLHIRQQNAGIIVSRIADGLNFEYFELSPNNESAMFTGRLVRSFPAYASKVDAATMGSTDFRKSISRTIATMTTQKAPGSQPQVRKNNTMEDEERDTTHPGMVTDFIMNVISACGAPIDVERITKNTREDVLWSNCLTPWRRSPLWLLLRVSLQLLFARETPDTLHADSLYKAFMVFMFSQLLALVCEYLFRVIFGDVLQEFC